MGTRLDRRAVKVWRETRVLPLRHFIRKNVNEDSIGS